MLKNMKIWVRFVLSFSLILALLIAVILVSLHQIKSTQTAFDRIMSINIVRLHLVNTMIDHTREASINLNNILLLKDSEKTSGLKNKMDSLRTQFDTEFKKFEELVTSGDTIAFKLINRIKDSRDLSRKINSQVIELAIAGNYNEAMKVMNEQAAGQHGFGFGILMI